GTATNRAFLTVSDGPGFAFGPHPVGSSTDHTFTVKNEGAATATALAVGTLTAPLAVKAGTSCTGTLAVQATCTVTVTFAPAATGAVTGTLSVAYNDGGSQQQATLPLSANGVTPATLVISDAPTYDFGQVAVGASGDHLCYPTT